MPFTITYRHKGETQERTAEASTAVAAVKLHDHLEASEAEVLFTKEDGEDRTLGELKHQAGKESAGGISSAQVLSHYATANVIRTAWLGEAKTLAFALGPKGIHVNTLSLGGTLSPWYREAITKRGASAGLSFEEQLAKETENVPLGKYGEPTEVATVIEQLLSPFSDHMTGLNILHDGGFTRAY
jgi:NAD(P)-dependent dehydrogenase (short-subunit alcohol dehydrogenase family)